MKRVIFVVLALTLFLEIEIQGREYGFKFGNNTTDPRRPTIKRVDNSLADDSDGEVMLIQADKIIVDGTSAFVCDATFEANIVAATAAIDAATINVLHATTVAGFNMDNRYYTETEIDALNHLSSEQYGYLNDGNAQLEELQSDGSPAFAGLSVDTDTLYVDSTNNTVGIGTTSPDTNATLHIVVPDGQGNGLLIENQGVTNAEAYIALQTPDTTTNAWRMGLNQSTELQWHYETQASQMAGSGCMQLDVSGNLEVTGNIKTSGTGAKYITIDGSSTSSNLLFQGGGTSEYCMFLDQGNDSLKWGSGASFGSNIKMTLLEDGSLGLGDTTPDYLLDVAGDIGTDGNIILTTANKKITQPDGGQISGCAAFSVATAGYNNYSGSVDVNEWDSFDNVAGRWIKYADTNTRYPTILLNVPGPEMLGGTVVVDQITLHLETTGTGNYIDSVWLKESGRAGSPTNLVNVTTNYGVGSTGTVSISLLASDLSRATYPNLWYVKLAIVDAGSGDLYLYDAVIDYHLE